MKEAEDKLWYLASDTQQRSINKYPREPYADIKY